MSDKKKKKTHRNRSGRRLKRAVCLPLLAVLCASTLSLGTAAFATTAQEAPFPQAEEADPEAEVMDLTDLQIQAENTAEEEDLQTPEEDPAQEAEEEAPFAVEAEEADPSEADFTEPDTQNEAEELPLADPGGVETDPVLETYIGTHLDPAYIASAQKMELVNIFHVKNTLFDGNYVSGSDTLDSVMYGIVDNAEALAKFLGMIETDVAVYNIDNESDYFVARINTMADTAKVQDCVFALNDTSGTVLTGCHFDAGTGLAYIPKTLYLDEDGSYAINRLQAQLMQVVGGSLDHLTSEVTSSVVEDDATDVYANEENIFRFRTTVQAEPGLKKEHLVVSVNGIPLADDAYSYNATTGTVTTNLSSAAVDSIAVTVESETLISRIKEQFAPITAQAAWSDLSTVGEGIRLPSWVTSGTALSGTTTMMYAHENMESTGEVDGSTYGAYVYWFGNDGSYPAVYDEQALARLIDGSSGDGTIADDAYQYFWLAKDSYHFKVNLAENDLTYAEEIANNRYAGSVMPTGQGIESLADLGVLYAKCTHVGNGSRNDTPNEWKDDVQTIVRFLYVDRTSNFAVMAVLGEEMEEMGSLKEQGIYGWDQAACAMYAITISPSEGALTLKKDSADTALSGGNDCYSLAGATYTVYTDAGCTTTAVGTDGSPAVLVTDKNGDTNTLELEQGDYWVKETASPDGYCLDTTAHKVNVTAEHTKENPALVKVSDQPVCAAADLVLYKESQESANGVAQGAATLSGAQFTIDFYAGYWEESSLGKQDPDRTWVLETVEEDGICLARLSEPYLISGGETLYHDQDGNTVLPLGTLSIRETKAPEGYTQNGSFVCTGGDGSTTTMNAGDRYVTQVRQDGDTAHIRGGNEYTRYDQVIRGDLSFEKQDGENQSTDLGSVPFRLTSVTTGESHSFWTDVNGQYSTASSWEPHTQNTNAGESFEDGIWFYGCPTGTEQDMEVCDDLGALPYDTYLLEELPCESNAGRTLITTRVTVYRDAATVHLGTIDNYEADVPGIATTMTDVITGSHQTLPDGEEEVTLTDVVSYHALETGKTYIIQGILMDRESGEAFLDADGSEVTACCMPFLADVAEGMAEISFSFTPDGLDTVSVVAFEFLYEADSDTLIAQHADLEDDWQTVELLSASKPTVSTTPEPTEPTAPAPTVTTAPTRTGDLHLSVWIVVVSAAAASLILAAAMRKRRNDI